jgi:acetyl-CoA carboxylase biotin carboxyl carrier protein
MHMSKIKWQDVEALLETFDSSNWNELNLKIDGLELFVSKTPGARGFLGATDLAESRAPIPVSRDKAALRASSAAAGETEAKETAIPHGLTAVRAPNLGTFYRSPKPGAPPYVQAGQRVEPSTEVCIIEVMKLFTSVHAGISGVVRQVLVEDSELVEFDQVLFLVEVDRS